MHGREDNPRARTQPVRTQAPASRLSSSAPQSRGQNVAHLARSIEKQLGVSERQFSLTTRIAWGCHCPGTSFKLIKLLLRETVEICVLAYSPSPYSPPPPNSAIFEHYLAHEIDFTEWRNQVPPTPCCFTFWTHFVSEGYGSEERSFYMHCMLIVINSATCCVYPCKTCCSFRMYVYLGDA